MTAHDRLDRQLDAFLQEGPAELPEASFYAVRDRTDQTGQRVVIGPWRMPNPMNKLAVIGLGAAAVVVALVVAVQLLPTAPGGVGAPSSAPPSPTPTPTPQATAAAPSASAATGLTPPPLTQTFTSQMHGISVSYPEGWTAQAATEPWTGTGGPNFLDPFADLLIDPLNENLFMILGSQPIGSSTPDEWVAETMANDGCSATEPIAVDSATGQIGCYYIVAVATAGRGYRIRLYTPTANEGLAFAPYDRAWFEEVLATVQLQPEDAVDVTPSATP